MPIFDYAKQMLRELPGNARLRHSLKQRKLREQIQSATPLNVILGSATTSYPGWIATDRDVLDISKPDEWKQYFEPASIDRLLTEHVLEHLSEEECAIALTECFRYLKKGGLLRVAVPDGYRRDAVYVAEASPPKDGHKVLFTVETLIPMIESAGFQATPLEYFDAQENFHAHSWDEADGLIMRSARFDTQQDFKRGELFYTSLIVDARKI